MAVVIVTSNATGEGKTAVAAAIARHYAYLGKPVRLARVGGPDNAANAARDASYFGALDFVPGSATAPVTASIVDPGDGILVVEADGESVPTVPGAKVVVVSRYASPENLPGGVTADAVVVTGVHALKGARSETPEGGAPTISLGEDRTLAGFSVDEARRALNAEVLVEGDGFAATCDYLVVAPIAADAGQPYFRRFDTKAVVVRFDKTDMHLAAMRAEPACLILTGGRRPSEYLFDAASAYGVPVMLSRTDTENTVIALEGIFDDTRFQGERKLDRMSALLDDSALYTALAL